MLINPPSKKTIYCQPDWPVWKHALAGASRCVAKLKHICSNINTKLKTNAKSAGSRVYFLSLVLEFTFHWPKKIKIIPGDLYAADLSASVYENL